MNTRTPIGCTASFYSVVRYVTIPLSKLGNTISVLLQLPTLFVVIAVAIAATCFYNCIAYLKVASSYLSFSLLQNSLLLP